MWNWQQKTEQQHRLCLVTMIFHTLSLYEAVMKQNSQQWFWKLPKKLFHQTCNIMGLNILEFLPIFCFLLFESIFYKLQMCNSLTFCMQYCRSVYLFTKMFWPEVMYELAQGLLGNVGSVHVHVDSKYYMYMTMKNPVADHNL